jgi:peptidoglycan/LPS O-acetylase OafA/YrhL
MGLYRFLLAWCVVIEHLSGDVRYLSHTGMFAVFGFYVLSGYLITRVLNDVYGFAFVPFWCNRFLRLYPPYLLLLLIGLVLVLGTPGAAQFFPAVWKVRPTITDWWGLMTIFPMGFRPMEWAFRPVPSIWSVGVEVLNYAILYAAVARHKHVAAVAAIAAGAYHLVSIWHGDDLGTRYFPFYAALLPFALGALIYFYARNFRVSLSSRAMALLCVPALANCIVAGVIGGVQDTAAFNGMFYLNLLFQCLAVTCMAWRGSPMPRTDKLFGDLSYPIFLCHWLVGYVLAMLLFHGQSRGLGLMLATLVGSTVVAYMVCLLQDALIEPLRSRVRCDVRKDLVIRGPDAVAGSV